MILQVYDGNIHPDEWLKQFNTYCFLKEITENNIKFAKMMIDSTINVPKDVTSLTEIISALKVDASFTIFKNTNKRKLQILKYKSENVGGDTAKFIDTFHLIEPTFNIFIKNGSIIALRHVATGKYLSTNENLRYETGSKSQMVFLGDTEPHRISFWKIKFDKDYATIDTFMTLQQRFDKFLGLRYNYSNYYKRRDKSPSQNTEVSCNVIEENDNDNKWRFDTNDLNYQGCLKSNDIITLSIKNEIVNDRYEFLRGHDFQVDIGKEVFKEVACHDKGIGVNDNWCIE
ncbi:unnamed protein product [Rhizophagus irregularis]|nr:unnamed protein product [Rhizophagus irregularis]